MPARARNKRKSPDDVENSDEEVQHIVASTARAKKKPATGRKPLKPLTQSTTRQDKDGAKRVPTNAKKSNKRRGSAAAAKREIQKKMTEVLALINESGGKSNGVEVDALRQLRQEHANVVLDNNSGPGIAEASEAIIRQCSTSAAEYNSISKRRTHIKQPDWMRWTQDAKNLQSLNGNAYDLALKIAEKGIIEGVTGKRRALHIPRRAGDLEKLAWEMMEEAMPREGQKTWGTVANAQLRALIALGRVLGPENMVKSSS